MLSLLRIRITYTLLCKVLRIALLLTLTRNLNFGYGSLTVTDELSKQSGRLLRRNTYQLTNSRSSLCFGIKVLQNFCLDCFVLFLLLGQSALTPLVCLIHLCNVLCGGSLYFVIHLTICDCYIEFSLRHNISSSSTVRRVAPIRFSFL